jgi:hypothetical protein
VLLAFVVWKMLPDGPASARWLSKEQAEGLERRLNAERESQASGGPWIAAAIGAATLPRFANTSSRSRQILIAGLIVMAAGLVIAAYSTPVIGLLGVCLSAFMFFVVQSIIFTFLSSPFNGPALAGGLALVNSCGLPGGFVGPTVMGLIEQSTGNPMNGLMILAGALFIAALCSMRLRHGTEDRAPHAEDRSATGNAI